MEINATNQVQGLETVTKISEAKREKEGAPDHQAAQTEENPDYRISLSDTSTRAVTGITSSQAPGQGTENVNLTEEEAARVSQQTAEQLSQTSASISNQAMQKAVDLFT
jgi:hypothetical protein